MRRCVLHRVLHLPLAGLACLLLLLHAPGATAKAVARPSSPVGLTTEYAVNPLGIDVAQPRLAWKLPPSPVRGTVQRAYQVQAAGDAAVLADDGPLLWDSGRIDSDQSVQLPYGGAPLRSGQRVAWRVRIWDGNGMASPWSSVAWFEAALLSRDDWRASWITTDPVARSSAAAPPALLRKTFRLPGAVQRARLYITSLGMYDARINGAAVTDQVLRPGWTSYHKRLQYQSYDVTALLRAGDNAIGVTLGDGWYRGDMGFGGRDNYGTRRALLAQLQVTLADGRVQMVRSDETWRASTGPVRMSDLLQGEHYDARLEKDGWAAPGYADTGWSGVQTMAPPPAALVAQTGPAVRRIMELKPVKLLRTPQGETVFDFGQNLVGWVRLSARGPAGSTVVLRHAEVLDKAGNFYTANLRSAAQTLRYTFRGGRQGVYEPSFTYQGFRYVAVEGLLPDAGADALTAIVVHSDMGSANSWTSSHTGLNQLVKNTEWGQRGNFLDVPTDCPQRNERLGWTGDVQVFARTAAYNFDVAGFYTKWMADLAADQKADGSIPYVIPDSFQRKKNSIDGAAGWSDAVVIVPWTVYQAYGDRRLLGSHYASMKAWVDRVAQLAPDGVWTSSYQFGDWLAYQSPSSEARDYPGATTGKDLIATAYFAHSSGLLARIATVLGHAADARRYAALASKVRAAFNREFVTASGRVGENSQTAYALALRFNLLPDLLQAQAAKRLVGEINSRKGHLSTGFLGTPALLFALSEHGQLDAAYRLLLKNTYPSWLYPVGRGATTIWERWDGIKPDGTFQDPAMNSFNHYAYGAVVEWMYAVAAGITSDPSAPGYRRSIISPRPPADGSLTHVRAQVETPYGLLRSGWQLDGDVLSVAVSIPPNTRARVVLPSAAHGRVSIDGVPLAHTGMSPGEVQGLDLAFEIGAGDYEFTVQSGSLLPIFPSQPDQTP